MPPVQPGTYRIINVKSGTCITVKNDWDAVGWQKHDGRDQQWYVQRSGEGYRFKNCETGQYLCLVETRDSKEPRTKVFCGVYPTTWDLRQESKDFNMYIIKQADANRIIDLNKWGSEENGTELFADPQPHWVPQQRWRFEFLSDDTGEEGQRLSKEIQLKDKQISEKDEELARIKKELAEKSAQLNQTQDALRRANEWLAAYSADSMRVELQKTISDLSEQKEKTKNLQEKISDLERLMSKIMEQTGKQPNNMA
ncbi:hypothetical protein FRC06_010702 [Ceratobasidium sp. 370]|nr:hypothetical protein FRC06_010702 [Ceratobasidium sp. 370]